MSSQLDAGVHLPGELVANVATFMGAEESCRTLSRLCKSWRTALLKDSALWFDFSTAAALHNVGPYHVDLSGQGPEQEQEPQQEPQPPWQAEKMSFAELMMTTTTTIHEQHEELGEMDHYQLWRLYALAEEEYRMGYLKFIRSRTSFQQNIQWFLERTSIMKRFLSIALWLLVVTQFALFMHSTPILPLVLLGVQLDLGLWWLLNGVPFALRWWTLTGFKWWLSHPKGNNHRPPQTRGFFEHVFKNNNNSGSTLCRPIILGPLPDEFRTCQIMRRQESAMLLSSAVSMLMIMLSEEEETRAAEWRPLAMIAAAIVWYLITAPQRSSLSVLGYVTALVIVICIPFVVHLTSAFLMLAPYVLCTAALWMELVDDLTSSFNGLHRRICPSPNGVYRRLFTQVLCFPCGSERNPCTLSNVAICVGIATLWTTGVLALLWTESVLYPSMAPTMWRRIDHPRLLILSPLTFNLVILGLAAI